MRLNLTKCEENMSAFMVSKKHIDLLVSTAFSGPRDAKGLPQSGQWHQPSFRGFHRWDVEMMAAVGDMLIQENIKSIQARYPDTIAHPDAMPGSIARYWNDGAYQIPSLTQRLTIIEAFKALACYEYQSCEHEGWEKSEAHKFCESFRDSLINVLPGYDEARGWDDWEFTYPTPARRIPVEDSATAPSAALAQGRLLELLKLGNNSRIPQEDRAPAAQV
jgi:hypothetical protein